MGKKDKAGISESQKFRKGIRTVRKWVRTDVFLY